MGCGEEGVEREWRMEEYHSLWEVKAVGLADLDTWMMKVCRWSDG